MVFLLVFPVISFCIELLAAQGLPNILVSLDSTLIRVDIRDDIFYDDCIACLSSCDDPVSEFRYSISGLLYDVHHRINFKTYQLPSCRLR